MAGRKKKIRKIVFGIRFKFAVVMAVGILFTSVLMGLVLYKQQENILKDSFRQWGSAILKGPSEHIEGFLYSLRKKKRLRKPAAKELVEINKNIRESRKKMADYFAAIRKKHSKKIDISFLIQVNWKSMKSKWSDPYNTLYYFFSRATGKLFVDPRKTRKHPLLHTTVTSYYMNHIRLGPYLTFADKSKENDRDYIIVGYPVVRNRGLYQNYLAFQRSKKSSLAKEKTRKYYVRSFLYKIITNDLEFDYQVRPKKFTAFLYYYFNSYYRLRQLNRKQRRALFAECVSLIKKQLREGKIGFKEIQKLFYQLRGKYSLVRKDTQGKENFRKNLYLYLMKKIPIVTDTPLAKLALLSYRSELAGIAGLFMLKGTYYADMSRKRNEIIDLIIAILIRAIFISIFFPTFIIRQITRVETRAIEIGRGNFEKRISVSGSDEIGRLADVLNIMAANMEKAQKEKIEKLRMEDELKTAEAIQKALLPATVPDPPGYTFSAFYSAQSESSGDYYDFIQLDEDRIGIVIADVSGHGVGSGLVMAMTRTVLHLFCKKLDSPREVTAVINDYLCANTESSYFVTMFYGILHVKTGRIIYSNAGHNQGIIVRNREITELPSGGIALGVLAGDAFLEYAADSELRLKKGDYFVHATDGVEESMNARFEEYGRQRFHQVLTDASGETPAEMINAVTRSIKRFTGKTPQHDDITMFIIQYNS